MSRYAAALMQTVAREAAPCVLEAMLHVICFVRLLGLLAPATHRIGDTELVRRCD